MGSFLQDLFQSHYFSNIHWILIMGHVSLALVAIITGPIPMIARKGGKNHKLIGKVFLWSMVTSLLLAIVLLFFRFNVFLAGITALSLNGVVTGVRSLHRKRAEQNNYAWFDIGFAVAMLLAGVGLFGYGVLTALGFVSLDGIPSGSSLRIVLVVLPIVFGLVIISDTRKDLISLYNPPTDRNWWWYYHMERMLGSYIALITAFAVQQIGPRMPESIEWAAWIAPSVIGSPLIAIWIMSYQRQFAAKDKPESDGLDVAKA